MNQSKLREERMKIRSVVARVGLAISFALPTFAQQKETVDPKLGEAQAAFGKKFSEAYNNNDAAAVAAFYADDAVIVTDREPVYGRQAIDKYFERLFQNVHFSNYLAKADPARGIRKGMADNEMWSNGEWSATIQVKGANPEERKGHWSSIKVLEGDTWKIKMTTFNVIPPPAATPSPTASPSKQ
jgi:uncharacterized protein (TIGR02246 family)